MATSSTIINPKERNEKVRCLCCIKPLSIVDSLLLHYPRVNTIHKSIEIKIQSEETGCRKSVIFISFVVLTRQLTAAPFIIRRWWCGCPSNQTTDRPNAGRISTSKQNSLPTKPPRIRHERSTAISLFSVGVFFPTVRLFPFNFFIFCLQIPKSIRSSSYSYQTRYCFRRIRGRRECRCGKGCITQLQVGWREQDQGASFLFPFAATEY